MNYRDPKLRQRLADDYILGAMTTRVQRRFERLLRQDSELAELVQRGQGHWHSLAELLPPTPPPARLWQGVEERIRPPLSHRGAGSRLLFWRGWALAASLALVIIGGYLSTQQPSLTAVNYLAIVTDDAQSQASWVIGADQTRDEIVIRALTPQPLPPDRTFQLWVQLPGEPQVRSVGLIPAEGQTTLTIPNEIAIRLPTAERVGVSIEPEGGSPTGQPTTTPLYHGEVIPL